ncbi:MAG: 2-dehydropantoate 2-reductase [Bacilli bacterium]
MKNIVVIGLGGVGGYFGFKINRTNNIEKRNHISFVVRNETYEKVKINGLKLLSSEFNDIITIPDAVYQNISEIRNPDLVLICVKDYDLESICNQLLTVITSKTVLFPMLNGVNIYERIRKIIPDNVILPSCIYVSSRIKEKGVIEQIGKPGKIIFGKDPEHSSIDISFVSDLFKISNINFEFKDDPRIAIWTKFMLVASFALVTSKYNSNFGTALTDNKQRKELNGIMQEIKSVTLGKGIALPDDIIEKTIRVAYKIPYKATTSLQLDINVKKEKNELELFAGAIIKYADELNIKVPFTKKIYDDIYNAVKSMQ